MKSFIKRLAGFSLGPILGAAISFLLFPIFMNLLPTGEFGRAGLFQSILTQIPNFIYLGLDQAYTREYNHYADRRSLMHQAMLPSLLLGIILSVIALLFARPLTVWLLGNPDYAYIILIAVFWLLMTIAERFIHLSIRMEEKAIEYSFFTLLLKIGNFIVSILLIWAGIRDFRVIIYGVLFGHMLADLILFIRYRHLLDFRGFQFNKELNDTLLKFGLPIMVATSLSVLLNLVDMFFLRQFTDFNHIGIYKAASQLAALFGIMKTAFASFWVPTAYRWYEEGKSMKHYQFISDSLMLILSAIFFALLVLKHPIALLLNPNGNYLSLKYIVALLAFPHLMYTLSETTTLGIVFSRKTFYNIIVSFLSLIVSVGINWILTPRIGFRGAAVASTFSYMIFYLSRTYFSSRTGFYFDQRKQIFTMILMVIAGLINLYPNIYNIYLTLALVLIAFIVQMPTIKTVFEIKNHSDQWDFT